MGTIYTHANVDLDAVCSVWAAKRFIPNMDKARIEFRPACWNGEGMKDGDLALDIEAGGRGIKGERLKKDGRTHSCFRSVMLAHASLEDRQAVKSLLEFVDIHDTYGSVVDHLFPRGSYNQKAILESTGLQSIFAAIKKGNSDLEMINIFSLLCERLLEMGRSGQRAEFEAAKAEVLGGKVAIVRERREFETARHIYKGGVKVMAYSNSRNGFYFMGLVRPRRGVFNVTDQRIQDFVRKEVGEEEIDDWFAHPDKYLYCRGSLKSAVYTTRSKLPVEKLAKFVLGLMN